MARPTAKVAPAKEAGSAEGTDQAGNGAGAAAAVDANAVDANAKETRDPARETSDNAWPSPDVGMLINLLAADAAPSPAAASALSSSASFSKSALPPSPVAAGAPALATFAGSAMPTPTVLQPSLASQTAAAPQPGAAALPAAPGQSANAPAPASAPATTAMPASAMPLPEAAFTLFKEWADASGPRGEADAPSPTASTVQLPSTASTLGLARTATVNPMDAPTADLHGDSFDDAVGSRLTWMAEQKVGHAHIRINPQELGPIEIRMRLDGERVHADFSSPHTEVRQALENSLPKLRDMLAQHGFQLAQADVGQHGQSGQTGRQEPSAVADDSDARPAVDGVDAGTQAPVTMRMRSNLLDAYA